MSRLTIACITKGEKHTHDYLRWMAKAADVLDAKLLFAFDDSQPTFWVDGMRHMQVRSKGYLESVLDEVMAEVQTEYVLRLDDDERISPAMLDWLAGEAYLAGEIFSFPRCNMWDELFFVNERPLFPDQQTRLTKKQFSLGWNTIHHGCPHGSGATVPVAILHDKFVLKTYAERYDIAKRYEQVKEGSGLGETYLPFGLPEDVYKMVHVWPVGDGYLPEWNTLPGKGEEVWLERH